MKQLLTGFFILILIAGVGAGAQYLYNQNTQQNSAAVFSTQTPPDDTDIPPLAFNGMYGARKTVTDTAGGTISVVDNQGIRYILTIPPGALAKTTEITLTPLLSDTSVRSLDTGVVVGPENTSFQQPVTLEIRFEQDDKQLNPAKTIAYQSIPQRKELIPQEINRALLTNRSIPIRILSNGAYLVSLNSTRAEALSRLVLAKETSSTLSIMEAARYLLTNGKHLSSTEMTLAKAAIDSVLTQDDPPAPEVYMALSLEKLVNYRSGNFISELYVRDICSDDEKSAEEKTTATAISKLESITDPGSCDVSISTEEAKLLTASVLPETAKTADFARSIAEDETSTAVQIAYALHRVRQVGLTDSTVSAKLYKDIQRKFTEKNIEEPTVYDFGDEEEAPLQGYDWSLIGHELLMIALSKKDIRFEDVKAHQAKIEPYIHDNQSFGHAFCSFYESVGFQTAECLPYEASVGTAKNILRLAADNVTHDVEGYSSPKIATSEADLEDN